MGDLDDEFALFEQEIGALEAEGAGEGGEGSASSAAADSAAKPSDQGSSRPGPLVKPKKVYASAPVASEEIEPSQKDLASPLPDPATLQLPGLPPPSMPPPHGMFGTQHGMMMPPAVPAPPPPGKMPAPSVPAPILPPSNPSPYPKKEEPTKHMRTAGGKKWEDKSLEEWPKGL